MNRVKSELPASLEELIAMNTGKQQEQSGSGNVTVVVMGEKPSATSAEFKAKLEAVNVLLQIDVLVHTGVIRYAAQYTQALVMLSSITPKPGHEVKAMEGFDKMANSAPWPKAEHRAVVEAARVRYTAEIVDGLQGEVVKNCGKPFMPADFGIAQ